MTEKLQKGANVVLSQHLETLENNLEVKLSWQQKSSSRKPFEIDCSAFLLTSENKVRNDADFIFYNQTSSDNQAILLEQQTFKLSLAKIPTEIQKIAFVLSIYEAKERQQSFSMLQNVCIELFDVLKKQTILSYCLEDAGAETSIILGQLYRYRQQWKFKAIGQGYIDGLDVMAKNFGVEIDNDFKELLSDSSPEKTNNQFEFDTLPQNIDIHNTDIMASHAYYLPILKWFKQKNILVEVNEEAVDTTGFFDEVAVTLGDNYDLLKIVSNVIKRRQQNGKERAYIDLSRYKDTEITQIRDFCKLLYDYSFVAKYFYNRQEKKVILHLQKAVKVVNFFYGEWLEWYAFMKIAALCQKQQFGFSCVRNMKICLLNENKYELDVFFLINNMPVFIECKSGEYREFIDKYSILRKKLNIDKPYFIYLILENDEAHIQGLNAMFDITFMNEKTIEEHVFCLLKE